MTDVTNKAIEFANIIKAFSGAEGETVWILRVYSRESHKALVQVCAVDHPLDDKILLCNVLKTEMGKRYVCTYKGDSYMLLSMEHGKGTLYLPDDMGFDVHYNAELSNKGKPELFLKSFLAQSVKEGKE